MGVTPRRYYAFFKFEGEQVALFEERLTDALNWLQKEGDMTSNVGLYANDYALLLEWGIGAIEEQMVASRELTESGVIYKELLALQKEKAMRANLAEIYEAVGLDAFVEWAEGAGVKGWQKALEEYNEGLFARKQERPWSEQARDWLEELLGDGRPHHVSEVKEAALKGGVLDNSSDDTIDRDWHKMKVIASRAGYSSKGPRGFWQE